MGIGGTTRSLTGITALPQGDWSHVAVTYDGSRLNLLVNGAVEATVAATGELTASTRIWRIGSDWTTDQFEGRIDEIRLYSTGLTVSDVALAMDTPVSTETGLQVSHVSPESGALGVTSTPIAAAFTSALNPATVTASAFELRNSAGSIVPITVSYDASTRTATLIPQVTLASLETYTAKALAGSEGVRSTSDVGLAATVSWSFRTAAAGSLVGAWPFSEGTGTVTADATGNGQAGSLTGSTAWESEGRYGTGLRFGSGAGGLDVAPMDALQLGSAFTVMAWLAPEGTGWRTVISRQAGPPETAHALLLSVSPEHKAFAMTSLGGSLLSLTGTTTLPSEDWSHVALTYDGSQLRLWVNGIVDAVGTATGPVAASSRVWRIGRDWTTEQWLGRIDEVRIYNTALPAADLALAMDTPSDAAAPLQVTRIAPASDANGVASTPIQATFSRALDPAIVTPTAVELRDAAGASVTGSVSYDAASRTVRFTPQTPLAPLASYTVTVVAGATGVRDLSGGVLANSRSWTFTTASAGSLAAAWSFQEGQGTTAADNTGNGNTATLAGSAAWDAAGRFDSTIRFSETAGHLEIQPTDRLQLSTGFSVMAWVAPEGMGWRPLLARQAGPPGTGPNITVYLTPDHQIQAWVGIGGSNYASTSVTALPASAWSHVAVTYDGSALRVLVNGVVEATTAATGSLLPSTRAFQMGRDWVGNQYVGRIDEVRIDSVGLSAAEVLALMTRPIVPPQLLVNGVAPANAVTVSGGQTLSSELTGGPANPTDWLALAAVGAPDSTFVARKYLNGSTVPPAVGASSATVSFTAPSTPGSYEVRFFANDGFERLATSARIDVQSQCAPTVDPDAVVSPAAGSTGLLSVAAAPDCAWAPASSVPWISVSAEAGYAGQVRADGAVGYWRLGDASGAVADSSGRELSGTIQGPVVYSQPGATADGNTALELQGGYVDVGPAPPLDPPDAFSLEAWVKQTGDTGGVIVSKSVGGSGYVLQVSAGHANFSAAWLEGVPVFEITGDTMLNDGQWHHVVGVFDPVFRQARLYVDGAIDTSGAAELRPAWSVESPFTIGAISGGFYGFFEGTIDEVAFYSQALTAAQTAQHYALRLAAATLAGTGVIGYQVEANPGIAVRTGHCCRDTRRDGDADRSALSERAS